jgi:hypothetical protein
VQILELLEIKSFRDANFMDVYFDHAREMSGDHQHPSAFSRNFLYDHGSDGILPANPVAGGALALEPVRRRQTL